MATTQTLTNDAIAELSTVLYVCVCVCVIYAYRLRYASVNLLPSPSPFVKMAHKLRLCKRKEGEITLRVQKVRPALVACGHTQSSYIAVCVCVCVYMLQETTGNVTHNANVTRL